MVDLSMCITEGATANENTTERRDPFDLFISGCESLLIDAFLEKHKDQEAETRKMNPLFIASAQTFNKFRKRGVNTGE